MSVLCNWKFSSLGCAPNHDRYCLRGGGLYNEKEMTAAIIHRLKYYLRSSRLDLSEMEINTKQLPRKRRQHFYRICLVFVHEAQKEKGRRGLRSYLQLVSTVTVHEIEEKPKTFMKAGSGGFVLSEV